MKLSMLLTIVSMLFVMSASALAEPVTLDAEPVRVSMFKNGLAMVTSRVEVPGVPGEPGVGTFQIAAPEARYGSLWLSWGEGLSLDKIIATEAEHNEEAVAVNLIDLLRANVGQSFSIRLHDEDVWLTGVLQSMPIEEKVDRTGRDRSIGFNIVGHPYPPPLPIPTRSELMLFETDDGVTAVSPSRVSEVRFLPGEFQTVVQHKTLAPVLRFDASGGEGGAVEMNYLAEGISWSPSYIVELTNEGTARLACKAVIVNDLMDLSDSDVELIAGYPNLRFSATPTAMSPERLGKLLMMLKQSGQRRQAAVAGNAMVLQQRLGYSGGYATSAMMPSMPSQAVAGEGAEDLYFYQLPGVTLAKGERGYFPMFSAEVPGRHIYTWDIPDFIDRQDRYLSQLVESPQVVWHSLELTNTTDQPWTTAPGMTVKDGRVLGQDMLNFTPPNGTSLLKITQAVSIDAQQNEVEVARDRNVEKFHGNTYDRVTVEGTLSITNYKAEAVTVKITKQVTGEVVSADGEPKVVKIVSGLRGVNPRSKLTWEIEVQPGAEEGTEVVYRYSFYTR